MSRLSLNNIVDVR